MANQTPFKIDDDSYREGQEAFKRGATLRSIVEQLATFGIDELEDRKTFSGVLGFGDALLDHLRNPAVVVASGEPVRYSDGFVSSIRTTAFPQTTPARASCGTPPKPTR
ncbi:hypothetical protein Rpal_3354 [Rhodopseudomonas palustris TIE-1]|uniref:hypothetical protein n=1 Tax=Rhodopseudomonas palustris TaxID=1076 RepID=UPI000164A5D5|nr:hypothetical protein [Rhodopseudomonas palustris]ACF01856.1 hypothetical protein Rpal_3354 [Rhodopseudomonas palustris TIE-1]